MAWTKEEYHEWLTAVGEAYAIMPDEMRQPYINARRDKSRSAREDADTQREIDAQQALINRSRAGVLETVVSECGSKTQPFTTASFLQEVRRCFRAHDGTGDNAQDSCTPGFFRYKDLLRRELQDLIWQKDEGSIDDSERFVYEFPCPLAHPGVCATEVGPAAMKHV